MNVRLAKQRRSILCVIMADSAELWFLTVKGERGLQAARLFSCAPRLAGKIVGVTLVFTRPAWGQVNDKVTTD